MMFGSRVNCSINSRLSNPHELPSTVHVETLLMIGDGVDNVGTRFSVARRSVNL